MTLAKLKSLAQARTDVGLTQRQVAERMGVSQARVAAIEKSSPGRLELKTVAAYVAAIGGTLQLSAELRKPNGETTFYRIW